MSDKAIAELKGVMEQLLNEQKRTNELLDRLQNVAENSDVIKGIGRAALLNNNTLEAILRLNCIVHFGIPYLDSPDFKKFNEYPTRETSALRSLFFLSGGCLQDREESPSRTSSSPDPDLETSPAHQPGDSETGKDC